MLEKKGLFAAVRRTEGREWIDMISISSQPSEVQDKDNQLKDQIPGWHKENPIARIVPIKITEEPKETDTKPQPEQPEIDCPCPSCGKHPRW